MLLFYVYKIKTNYFYNISFIEKQKKVINILNFYFHFLLIKWTLNQTLKNMMKKNSSHAI